VHVREAVAAMEARIAKTHIPSGPPKPTKPLKPVGLVQKGFPRKDEVASVNSSDNSYQTKRNFWDQKTDATGMIYTIAL